MILTTLDDILTADWFMPVAVLACIAWVVLIGILMQDDRRRREVKIAEAAAERAPIAKIATRPANEQQTPP